MSRVKEHQINALLAAKHGTLTYKISDSSFGYKPFDCISLRACPAFVVILYPSGKFYLIDIDVFQKENAEADRRSLLESRALELSSFLGEYGQ